MLWTPRQVAEATGGRVLGSRAEVLDSPVIRAVTIDSRRAGPGALFVPVRAARDGHDFIADASAAGAVACLVEAGHPAGASLPPGLVAIEVDATPAALLELGRASRRRLHGPVVGITGSVGKTSTKDLTAAALRAALVTAASEESWNNELGVPLTLANAPDDTEATVVEMGARRAGHIALLCSVAKPTMAVVTAVAAAHTEHFGGLEEVAAAKGELVEALLPSGTAVLNADDPRVAAMGARTQAAVVRYAYLGAPAEVTAEEVALDDQLRPSFVLRSPWGARPVRLAARGAHQVGNALAAATVALACSVPVDQVADALERAEVARWRMELAYSPAGAAVVNDAYNANPASMAAGLRALAALPAHRRVAVLGEMAQLGGDSAAEHAAVAALAAGLGIRVVAVGTPAYGVLPLPAGDDDAVLAALGPLGPGDAVLVKASRVAGLERLAARLAAAPTAP